jgi:hypothetical protein
MGSNASILLQKEDIDQIAAETGSFELSCLMFNVDGESGKISRA